MDGFMKILKKTSLELFEMLRRFMLLVIGLHILGYYAFYEELNKNQISFFNVDDLFASLTIAVSMFIFTLFFSNLTDKDLDRKDIINFILAAVTGLFSLAVTYFGIDIYLKDNFEGVFGRAQLSIDKLLFVWGMLIISGVFNYNSVRAEYLIGDISKSQATGSSVSQNQAKSQSVAQAAPPVQPVAQATPPVQPVAQATPPVQPVAQATPPVQPVAQATPKRNARAARNRSN
jgi:hypothetical protein